MRINRPTNLTPQQGVATLVVVQFLVLAVVLVLMYTNRGAILEQRLSANDVRARQAFAAANAGIDHALAHMQNGGIDHDSDDAADALNSVTLTNTSSGASPVPSFYQVTYCDPTAALPACPSAHTGAMACTAPTDFSKVAAVSCGWSDDDTSVQRISQILEGTASTAGTAAAPLVSRGVANLLTGGASILNYFNDLTVWSGQSLLGQSNTGKTFTRDIASQAVADPDFNFRNVGTSPACNNPPNGYTCSTQGSSLGHDTIVGDTNLASLSSDAFFAKFFGKSPTVYRDSVATWKVDLTGSLSSPDSTSVSTVEGKDGQVVWVEGNMDLVQLGSLDRPSILIVNGNLNLSSNPTVYGLVYVTGSITGSGSPTVYGAMITNGSASANGNIKVVYDPASLSKVNSIGKAARLPGGFRDW